MSPQFLANVQYCPSSPMAAFPKVMLPKRKNPSRLLNFPQGGAKAIVAQCSTKLPWLCPLFLPLLLVPFAKQHKPVFNAYKLHQLCQAPQMDTNDPSLIPQAPLPQTFPPCHKESGKTSKLKKVKWNPLRRRFSEAPPSLGTLQLLFPPL